MSEIAFPFLCVVIVGSCIGAGSGFCGARNATDDLEQLGKSVSELESAPLGIRVKLEGQLEESDRSVKSFTDGRDCVGSYVRLATISETEDSDGDTETHSVLNLEARRSADVFRFRRGARRVAIPSNYWNPKPTAMRSRTQTWPSWARRDLKRGYRGSFSHYEIDQICLVAGATHFVVGAVDRVTDNAQPGRSGMELMEVAEPIIWLRPEPAHGPVELWPGSEAHRVDTLLARRSFNRRMGVICLIIFLVGGFIAFFWARSAWR